LYTSTPAFVGTQAELTATLNELRRSDFVAVDTEFLRERTYFPKLCLVQLATEHHCALLDVLALQDLSELWEFLCDRSRTKVFHAARQDLEVLALARGAQMKVVVAPIAGPIFDTQVAAGFLNLPAQIGYADLVQKRLGNTLDKGQTRTDWSQRPLSTAQLRYAADDVIYLVDLYRNLKEALHALPQMQWIAEDAAGLENPKLFSTDPLDAWQRLRGLEQLQPEQRAAAKALAEWREQRAIQKDLPRSWVLSDDVLRLLAERLPATPEQLQSIHGLAPGLAAKRGGELLELIAAARTNAASEPEAKAAFKPTRAQMKRVTRLMEAVRAMGTELEISPELLVTRREVERLVYTGQPGSFMQGWRADVVGTRLMALAQEIREDD